MVIIIDPTIANNNINATTISKGDKVVYIILPILDICEMGIKFPSHLIDVDKSISVFKTDSVLILLYINIENIKAKGKLLAV